MGHDKAVGTSIINALPPKALSLSTFPANFLGNESCSTSERSEVERLLILQVFGKPGLDFHFIRHFVVLLRQVQSGSGSLRSKLEHKLLIDPVY